MEADARARALTPTSQAGLAAGLAAALGVAAETLPHGIVVVDDARRILWANAAARDVFSRTAAFVTRGGSLAMRRAADSQRLRRLIAEAVANAGDGPGQALAGAGRIGGVLAVRDPPGSLLHVVALGWSAPDGGQPSGGATLLVLDPAAGAAPPAPLLLRCYGFTPTQARLAALLIEGRSLAEASGALGITPGTARAHLRRLFAATGTHRQAELVRVLLRGPGALNVAVSAPCQGR